MPLVCAATSANYLRADHTVLVSRMDRRWLSEEGLVKLGQPVPLSNFAPALNSGCPHRRQVYTPSRFSSRKTPQKATFGCISMMTIGSSIRTSIGGESLVQVVGAVAFGLAFSQP
jgi:hypothetical protein